MAWAWAARARTASYVARREAMVVMVMEKTAIIASTSTPWPNASLNPNEYLSALFMGHPFVEVQKRRDGTFSTAASRLRRQACMYRFNDGVGWLIFGLYH